MHLRSFYPWLIASVAIVIVALGLWRSPPSYLPPQPTAHNSHKQDWQTQPSSWSTKQTPPSFKATQAQEKNQQTQNQLNRDRLLQDVEALAFDRSSADGRDQTRRYITRQLQTAGWDVIEAPYNREEPDAIDLAASSPAVAEPATGINLVAVRPGDYSDPTDSDPPDKTAVLIVGAHYDTVADSPGADDNGSSVAAMLELARWFGDRPTAHPLMLVLFDQEERGLWGSRAFVEGLVDAPSAPPLQEVWEDRPQIIGAIILEMLGYACDRRGCQTFPAGLPIQPPSDRGDFLAIVGNLEHPELIEAFQPRSPQSQPPATPFFLLPLQVPARRPGSPDLMRSDHVPFWESGYGAVMVTDTANFRNPHYHQPSDRPDTLNAEFLHYAATTVAQAIARLLSAPDATN